MFVAMNFQRRTGILEVNFMHEHFSDFFLVWQDRSYVYLGVGKELS